MPSIVDRYELGLFENWDSVVELMVDLENSGKLDDTTLSILNMTLDGFSFREIGKKLGISHNTAIKRLRELMEG